MSEQQANIDECNRLRLLVKEVQRDHNAAYERAHMLERELAEERRLRKEAQALGQRHADERDSAIRLLEMARTDVAYLAMTSGVGAGLLEAIDAMLTKIESSQKCSE